QQPLTMTLFPYTTLFRSGETYKSDLEIAKHNQEAAEKELAGAVAQSQETNQVKVTLRQLESSAKNYRSQYDSLLQRYTETLQQQDRKSTRLNSSHQIISY